MREDINADYKKHNSTWEVLKLTVHYISKIVLWSIFLILIIVAITLIVYFVDLKRNIKNGENPIPLFNAYVIISPSMVPAIKVQDAVIVMRVPVNSLKKNDIITFDSKDPRYDGITITHRIVGIENKGTKNVLFRTKGDNNNAEDTALVKGENIYGKVILKLPKIGYVQYFLSNSFGWVVAIVIPCLAIIIYDIIKLIKAIGRETSSSIRKSNQDNNSSIPKTVSSSDFKTKKKRLKESADNDFSEERKNKKIKNNKKYSSGSKYDENKQNDKIVYNRRKRQENDPDTETEYLEDIDEEYLEVLRRYSSNHSRRDYNKKRRKGGR